MFLIIIAAILGIIGLILIISTKSKYGKKQKERERYINEFNNYLKQDYILYDNFDNWLQSIKERPDLVDIDDTSVTTINLFMWSIILLIMGVIILGTCNILNKADYDISAAKSEMYQTFVDTSDDKRIAQNSYEMILSWNNEILSYRYYQDNWFFGSHHLLDGDWNNIPLVEFNTLK